MNLKVVYLKRKFIDESVTQFLESSIHINWTQDLIDYLRSNLLFKIFPITSSF